jgi:hypothetical protein
MRLVQRLVLPGVLRVSVEFKKVAISPYDFRIGITTLHNSSLRQNAGRSNRQSPPSPNRDDALILVARRRHTA